LKFVNENTAKPVAVGRWSNLAVAGIGGEKQPAIRYDANVGFSTDFSKASGQN
jgi:hypothetical protein